MHLMYFTEQPMSAYPEQAGRDFRAGIQCGRHVLEQEPAEFGDGRRSRLQQGRQAIRDGVIRGRCAAHVRSARPSFEPFSRPSSALIHCPVAHRASRSMPVA